MRVYDELIQFSKDYLTSAGAFPVAADPQDRAAEIAYLVLRFSKGDVRLRMGILARALGLRLRVLSRHFRRLYGTTLKESQIRLRIEWACHAMRTSPDRKIASIAAESGYSDTADFNHAFRKYMKMSPRQYQQDCRDVHNRAEPSDS